MKEAVKEMEIKLLYHTPAYHKLVETVARVCYQSYHKDDLMSHNFIKAIMAKGHISVASVGNLVFAVTGISPVLADFLLDAHEITHFIKWTRKTDESGQNPHTQYDAIVSMNMLTFLDLYNAREKMSFSANYVFAIILQQMNEVPYLQWFYDKSVSLPEQSNPYTAAGIPKLYAPIVLDEDYTDLAALGLTDYELGIHAQITMNFITDRSSSLQFWRHWAGGCELSQRYVSRANAEFRDMVGLTDFLAESTHISAGKLQHLLEKKKEDALWTYEYIMELCEDLGLHKARAKEVARSILPNNIVTQCIQSRPYRNWLHLFNLRDSKHAQREIQEDVITMKRELVNIGVPV